MPLNPLTTIAGLLLLVGLLATDPAWGWGSPHGAITQAALSTLPGWQQELLGEELGLLGRRYCIIPDLVYTDRELAPYATMDSQPGVVYLVGLHLPAAPPENHEVIHYFLGRAVDAQRAGRTTDAARYAGTLVHALEDWGCPAHVVPGDNMFTLLQQLLPPPSSHQYALLHGPIEAGTLRLDLRDRAPQLLGDSVAEAAFRLLHRANQATLTARGQVAAIIQALYAGDGEAVTAAQLRAATLDAELVADALYTLFCLATDRPDEAATAALRTFDLAAAIPLEAPQLYLPQAAFFSAPYWGFARSGVALEVGTRPVPLKLRVAADGTVVERTLTAGLGTGTRSILTYLVPPGVYTRFTALAGLHADLGRTGHVKLEVLGDGRPLAAVELTGDQPAHAFDCPLDQVTRVQLVATSRGGDGQGNHVVWGEPCLRK